MKWIIPVMAVAFVLFFAAVGTNTAHDRRTCEAQDGVFFSRDYLCVRKECVIDVSH